MRVSEFFSFTHSYFVSCHNFFPKLKKNKAITEKLVFDQRYVFISICSSLIKFTSKFYKTTCWVQVNTPTSTRGEEQIYGIVWEKERGVDWYETVTFMTHFYVLVCLEGLDGQVEFMWRSQGLISLWVL